MQPNAVSLERSIVPMLLCGAAWFAFAVIARAIGARLQLNPSLYGSMDFACLMLAAVGIAPTLLVELTRSLRRDYTTALTNATSITWGMFKFGAWFTFLQSLWFFI
jgi:hypothetical protein